jgi:hypothetical protein
VAQSFVTADGHKLGEWLNRQFSSELSKEKITLLEALNGWRWPVSFDKTWDISFLLVAKYCKETGEPVKATCIYEGKSIGQWMATQKKRKKQGFLSNDRIQRLESLPYFAWDVKDDISRERFDVGYCHVKEYSDETGSSVVPVAFKSPDGFATGAWRSAVLQRKNKLSDERILLLESLPDWTWDILEEKWSTGYSYAKEYADCKNTIRMPKYYKTPDGYNLAVWLSNQRRKKEKLSPERLILLESLPGWFWNLKEDIFQTQDQLTHDAATPDVEPVRKQRLRNK